MFSYPSPGVNGGGKPFPRLLFVDDEDSALNMYKRILSPDGDQWESVGEMKRLAERVFETRGTSQRRPRYDLVTCRQGGEAVEAVKAAVAEERPFSIAYIDVRMPPGPDGVWTAEQIRMTDPHIEIVIVTGFSDVPASEIAGRIPPPHKLLYIQKPFHVQELVQLTAALSAKWETEREAYHLYLDMDKRVSQRTRDIEAANAELEKTLGNLRTIFGGIVQVLTGLVEIRDPYTAGHQVRVADLARSIATEMGFEKDRIEGIRVAGVVHDIGKIAIPSEILSKPGRLNENEFALIKNHPKVGFDLLRTIDFPWPVADIVYQHHERLDGSGYPQGLKADGILMEARILTVADVVEAMATHRPYRPSLGVEKALEEIARKKGILYDRQVAEACLVVFNKKGYLLK